MLMMLRLHLCLISMGLLIIGVQNTFANPLAGGSKEYFENHPADIVQNYGLLSKGHDNGIGYLKKANKKGGNGYENFETFHNKDGDSYGYEKHEAYGKSNKGDSTNGKKGESEHGGYQVVEYQDEKPKKGDGKKENRYSYSRRYTSDNDDDAAKDSGNGDNERYINVSDDDYDNEKENLREADDNEDDDGEDEDEESSKYTSDVFGADDNDGDGDDGNDSNDKGALKAVTDGKGYANKIGRNIYESYIVHNSPKGGANAGDGKKAVSQSYFQLGKSLLNHDNDDDDKDDDGKKKKKADYTHASYESDSGYDGDFDGNSDHSSYGYDVDHDDDSGEGGDDGEHYQSYAREYDDDADDEGDDDY